MPDSALPPRDNRGFYEGGGPGYIPSSPTMPGGSQYRIPQGQGMPQGPQMPAGAAPQQGYQPQHQTYMPLIYNQPPQSPYPQPQSNMAMGNMGSMPRQQTYMPLIYNQPPQSYMPPMAPSGYMPPFNQAMPDDWQNAIRNPWRRQW